MLYILFCLALAVNFPHGEGAFLCRKEGGGDSTNTRGEAAPRLIANRLYPPNIFGDYSCKNQANKAETTQE